MLIINKDSMRLPIGGHQYPSHSIMFRGDTFDQLVERLTDFRISNSIPLGDPEQEILFHYSDKWPFMVKSIPDLPKQEGSEFKRWRKWIQNLWSNPPKNLLVPKEAKERYSVCENCKFNVRYSWLESRESDELKRRAFLLRRGVDIPSYLQFCSLHGCDLGVMVFLESPEKFSDKEKDKPGYDKCWVGPHV